MTKKNGSKKDISNKKEPCCHKSLIDNLTKDLEPVTPQPRCHTRTLQFVLFSYLVIFCAAVLIGFRRDIHLLFDNVEVLGQVIALLLAGILSVIATFRLTIPSETVGRFTWGLIGSSVLLITIVILYCASGADMRDMDIYMNWDMIGHRLKNFAFLAIVPTILMVWMIRKGRPVHTSLVGFTSFLAITCISVSGCRMLCPVDSLFANLMWHYLPIILFSCVGNLIGRYIYRW